MTKTYIAKGLLEYHLLLNVGGLRIPVVFTGGQMGSNGVLSARFTTDNKAIQQLIEKSNEYIRGKIGIPGETGQRNSR